MGIPYTRTRACPFHYLEMIDDGQSERDVRQRTANNEHVQQLHNIEMAESLEYFYFS